MNADKELIDEYLKYYHVIDNPDKWSIAPRPGGHSWVKCETPTLLKCSTCSQKIRCTNFNMRELGWISLYPLSKPVLINCSEMVMKKALE